MQLGSPIPVSVVKNHLKEDVVLNDSAINVKTSPGDLTDFSPSEEKLYILREKPLQESSFVEIVAPNTRHHFKILSKDGSWFKLEMNIKFKYAPSPSSSALFTAGPFIGYWQAPCDENGYPYLIYKMIEQNRWAEIAEKLKNKVEL